MKVIVTPLIALLLTGVLGCAPKYERKPILNMANTEVVEASLGHATQLIEQGKVAEAITAFRTLLRRDGPSLPVLNGLAVAHAELGRPDLAAGFFADALALAPDDPATLNNIGYAALRREEVGLARHYLERAERGRSGAPEISGNLDVLKRLETSINAPVSSKAIASDGPAATVFTMQRKTASTVELNGLQFVRASEPPQQKPVRPPEKALIDFSDLFDPWSTSNRQKEPSF